MQRKKKWVKELSLSKTGEEKLFFEKQPGKKVPNDFDGELLSESRLIPRQAKKWESFFPVAPLEEFLCLKEIRASKNPLLLSHLTTVEAR